MQTLLALLARSRKLIALSSLVAIVFSAIFAFCLPPMYTASTSLLPSGSSDSSSAQVIMGSSSTKTASSLEESARNGNLYMGLLASESVRRDVIDRLHLMQIYNVKKESEAEKKLSSRTLVEIGVKNPIVTISVMDPSPDRARDLAAAYLSALKQALDRLAFDDSSRRRQFYEQRLTEEKAELARADAALKQAGQETGFVAPATQVQSNIRALAQVQAQLAGLEANLAALLQSETNENPDVVRLRDEIGNLRTKATQMESGAVQSTTLSMARVPELQLEYFRKFRDVKYHETLLDIIAKQYEAAGLDQETETSLQVLEQPVVPDTKSGPRRSLLMLLGLLMGLLASSSWVIFQAAQSNSPLVPGRQIP